MVAGHGDGSPVPFSAGAALCIPALKLGAEGAAAREWEL